MTVGKAIRDGTPKPRRISNFFETPAGGPPAPPQAPPYVRSSQRGDQAFERVRLSGTF